MCVSTRIHSSRALSAAVCPFSLCFTTVHLFFLFSICLSVFLKDRMHGDEGVGRWGESGKR